MPKRTTVADWPSAKPDYWAGERGGRPTPRSAPLPKRGDKLPRNIPTNLVRVFRSHTAAVEYARTFERHVPIQVKVKFDEYDNPYKLFIVKP